MEVSYMNPSLINVVDDDFHKTACLRINRLKLLHETKDLPESIQPVFDAFENTLETYRNLEHSLELCNDEKIFLQALLISTLKNCYIEVKWEDIRNRSDYLAELLFPDELAMLMPTDNQGTWLNNVHVLAERILRLGIKASTNAYAKQLIRYAYLLHETTTRCEELLETQAQTAQLLQQQKKDLQKELLKTYEQVVKLLGGNVAKLIYER